jgi:hypothetical protein
MKLKTKQELSSCDMAKAISSKSRCVADRPAPRHANLIQEASSKPFVMGDAKTAARNA